MIISENNCYVVVNGQFNRALIRCQILGVPLYMCLEFVLEKADERVFQPAH